MSTLYPTITNEQELASAINELIKIDPRFAELLELTGLPQLRSAGKGYQALFDAILGQQISTFAANTIRERLKVAGLNCPQQMLEADVAELKDLGLSKQKTTYLKSLAAHNLDYEQLEDLPDQEIIDLLTQVKGIGKWTAEIYLLFSLHRQDVCAHNDLALRKATKVFLELATLPTEKEMRKLWLQWSPQRSAAAHLLWAYHGYLKGNNLLP